MNRMWARCWVYATFLLLTFAEDKKSTELVREARQDERPLLLATLGGGMVAVHQATGETIWKLKDEPVVKVPSQDGSPAPQFLPDPRHGFLYMYGARAGEPQALRKLPFTIPELVANAPCRSTDGTLYTGKKSDTWFMIDPRTGFRVHVSGFDKSKVFNGDHADTCSLDKSKGVYLARTEYTVLMHNPRSSHQRWNVTFYDYTSHDMAHDMLNHYGLIHFTSASNGRVMSFDRQTGDLVWSCTLDTPVVAAYLLDRDGLMTVPFNSIGDDTMDHIMDDVNTLRNGHGLKNSNMELFPTLYVGEHNHGLYALSSLVDKNTITISTEQTRPLLLEGPMREDQTQQDRENLMKQHFTNVHYKINDLNLNTVSAPFLLLGHYKMPELTTNWLPTVPTSLIVRNDNYQDTGIKLINGQVQTDSESDTENDTKGAPDKQEVISVGVQTDEEEDLRPEGLGLRPHMLYKQGYVWLHQQENKGLKVALIVLVGLVITMFWYLQNQAREFQQLSQGGSRGSSTSSGGQRAGGEVTAQLEEVGEGEMRIGRISFHTDQVLGKGCEGTFVYRGTFDKRAVAVKRLLPECFTFADREVALLRESDAHANVVRYYCTERDKQFRYIALELCAATLQDYVEMNLTFECTIDPIEVLRQATLGLAHLHSMDIVHRDIKPHNVLLSVPSGAGAVRAMISDFGLSKKLRLGRASFSRRSGVTGTDGWIAPEMISGERTTTAVDIFSLGCVFYYVLSQGRHPFGDVLRRQANILSDEYDLRHLESTCEEEDLVPTKIVIRAMVSAHPYKRPPCSAVLKNPIFWSPQTRLNFLQDVSDQMEGAEGGGGCAALEEGAAGVVRGDWRAHVCERVAADLRARRTYRGHSVLDLLRALRNKKHHYRELEPEVRESLGKVPEGFVRYWLRRFPLLLPHAWCQLQARRHDDAMRPYYPPAFTYPRADQPELAALETEPLPQLSDRNQLFLKSKQEQDEEARRKAPRRGNHSPRKAKPESEDVYRHPHYSEAPRERQAPARRRQRRIEDTPVWTLPPQ